MVLPHPVRSPENKLGFYLLALNVPLSQGSAALQCARARCAAAFARLPHSAMLHQRAAQRDGISWLAPRQASDNSRRGKLPSYLFALIELPRVFRHFEAADEVGIAPMPAASAPMQLDFSVGKNVDHSLTSFCRMACSL
jgi:hypothetical protein